MARQTINVGASANDGSGDAERVAWIKANANFDELYTLQHQLPRVDKSASTALAQSDAGKFVRVDASGGAVILTLPASGAADGDVLRIVKADTSANRVTVQTNGGGDAAWLSTGRDLVEFAWWGGAWVVAYWNLQPLRQVFTSSGTSFRPPLAASLEVLALGGGGGGGGGRCSATGSIRCGGAGGAAAAVSYLVLPASAHGASETVSIGAGGASGTSAGTAAGNGGGGGTGGITSLGALVKADGGGGGGGGSTAASVTGGTAPVTGTFGTSGAGGISATTSSSLPGGTGIAGGGAGGGGIDASNVLRNAGAGGSGSGHSNSITGGGSGGTTGSRPGAAGTDVTDALVQIGGGGGGGGYAGSAANGGVGGAGGNPGGGGGGGGGCDASYISGAGGAGGRGELRLTWHFG
ncbi:MAG: hypothetical protein ABW023_16745 [Sphingomonas sp.]